MSEPKIGRREPLIPGQQGPPLEALPPKADEAERPVATEMVDLEYEMAFGAVPTPPQVVLDEIRRRDQVWRWLSTVQVKYHGMRDYEQYSLSEKERAWIQSHPAFGWRVGVDNALWWHEGNFLGVAPRQRVDARQRVTRRRTDEQTKASHRPTQAYQDSVARAGGKIAYHTVEETVQRGE